MKINKLDEFLPNESEWKVFSDDLEKGITLDQIQESNNLIKLIIKRDRGEHLYTSYFKECDSLEEVYFEPFSITELPSFIFDRCSNLKKVYLPRGLEKIKYYAFSDCTKLEYVNIPDTVKEIEPSAGGNCSHLFSGIDKENQITVDVTENLSKDVLKQLSKEGSVVKINFTAPKVLVGNAEIPSNLKHSKNKNHYDILANKFFSENLNEEAEYWKTDKEGTQYYREVIPCDNCNGSGVWYSFYGNGYPCKKCKGKGTVNHVTKVFTPAYLADKKAKEDADREERLKKFYKYHGFDENGNGFIVIGNTYDKKEDIKAQGGSFNGYIKQWISPKRNRDFSNIPVTAADLYEVNRWGVYEFPKDLSPQLQQQINDRIKLDKEKEALLNPSTSNFVGNVGDNIVIDVKSGKFIRQLDTQYGTCYLYKFEDAEGNIYTWFAPRTIDEFNVSKLTAKVKKHQENNGVKETVIGGRVKVE